MTYELSKQLKDAGFPQGDIFPLGDSEKYSLRKRGFDPDIYFPNLSELISACPKNQKLHDMVFDFTLMYIGTQWFAGYWAYDYSEGAEGRAATPEEAVAKLWLAIKAVEEKE